MGTHEPNRLTCSPLSGLIAQFILVQGALRFFWSRGHRNEGLWLQPIPGVRKSRTSDGACALLSSFNNRE